MRYVAIGPHIVIVSWSTVSPFGGPPGLPTPKKGPICRTRAARFWAISQNGDFGGEGGGFVARARGSGAQPARKGSASAAKILANQDTRKSTT